MVPIKDFFFSRQEKQASAEQELVLIDQKLSSAIKREQQFILQTIRSRFPDIDLVDLPNTLRNAYTELISLERPTLQDLARYYAHFLVTNRIEHDHSARNEVTRDFYRRTAERKGGDIFPAPEDIKYANQFDDYLENAETNIAAAREHEQEAYLAFQEQVHEEINNVQSLMLNSDLLGSKLQEANVPNADKTIKFLNRTLDNMLKAEKKSWVKFYARESVCLLMLLQSTCCDLDPCFEIEDSIRKLKRCIVNFSAHHIKLMHSLTDKHRELQISMIIKILAMTTSLTDMSKVIENAGLTLDLESHRLLSMGIFGTQFSVDKGLNQLASSVEKESLVGNRLLHNIKSVKPKESLPNVIAGLEPEKVMFTINSIILGTAIGIAFPPAGACLTAVGIGEAAKNFYYSHKALNYVKETARSRRIGHEIELQNYLTDYPEETRILFIPRYLERVQKLQKIPDARKALAQKPEENDIGNAAARASP